MFCVDLKGEQKDFPKNSFAHKHKDFTKGPL